MSSFIKGVCIAGILLIPGVSRAQLSSAAIAGGPVITPFNTPAANVPVRVCLLIATGTPCSTAGVTLYSDYALTHPIANPTSTNALGTYTAFVPTPGTYLVQIQVTPTTTYSYPITAQSGNISGSLTAGRLILASGVNTIANSLADYGLTTSGHFTFPAPVDTQGGTLTGPLVGQKNTFKLPRIDATHPDFSSGCSGAYTACAINNALAYRASQCAAISISPQQCPPVYLSEGTYTLEATIKWPLNTTLIGDGTQSTTLLEPSNATWPAITAEPVDTTHNTYPFFGQIRDLTIAGTDHTSTGTGIDLEMGNPGGGAAFISHVNFFNLGGIGIATSEQAEKSVCDTCTFEYVRQAAVVVGDSMRFPNITVNQPGVNTDGYRWNVNCTNGVCPASGAIAPENRHAAIYVMGDQDWFTHIDCKPLAMEPCFKFYNSNDSGVDGGYQEGTQFGATWGGSINSAVLHPGLPDAGDGSGTVASCPAGAQTYACVSSSNAASPWNDWWPYVIGDPANIHTALLDNTGVYRGKAYIFCQDYAAGSAAPCASNPGVQQGQWEIALVVLSQGKWYLTNRNLAGSTAPSNTAWVNPHFEFPDSVSDIGQAVQIKNSTLTGINLATFNAGYSQNCTDSTVNQCQEVGVGGMDDSYIFYRFGPNDPSGGVGTDINVAKGLVFTAAHAHTVGTEATGAGWIKSSARGGFSFNNTAAFASGGETSEISTGSGSLTKVGLGLPFAYIATSGQGSVNTDGGVFYGNSAATGASTPTFLSRYWNVNPGQLGNNPNFGLGVGWQFYNSQCMAGLPTAGGANFRPCWLDGNNSGGPAVVWQTTSNGNAASPTWTTVATLSASGLSGSWVSPQFSPIPVNAFSFTAVASGSAANCTAYSSVAISAGQPTFTYPSSITLPSDGVHNAGVVTCADINGNWIIYNFANGSGGTAAQTVSIATGGVKFNSTGVLVSSAGIQLGAATQTTYRCVGGTLDGQMVWKTSVCTGAGGTTTSTTITVP